MNLQATIRNAPDYPPSGEIAVHDAPASGRVLFKLANGAGIYSVLSIAEDPSNAVFNDQPYLWFQLQLPGNLSGWVRDEYIELTGDGRDVGLGMLNTPTRVFNIIHGSGSVSTEDNPPVEDVAETPVVVTPIAETPVEMTPAPAVTMPAPVATVSTPTASAVSFERAVRVALDITATFEGGYSSYQTIDTGIISYGRFQFTLAGGALYKVVAEYLKRSTTETANSIKAQYATRIRDKDESLRPDETLKALLREAARETAMQDAQNLIAKEKYWDVVMELSASARNIQTPLGRALLLDMGINHGTHHDMLTLSEEALGVPPRSRMPENGVQEVDFIRKVADIRKERMYRIADKYGYGGLKVRADFWVNTIAAGDWELMGNANGEIIPKSGRVVLAR